MSEPTPVMRWSWKYILAMLIGAGLWVAIFYLIGAFLYWVFFVLR